MQVQPGNANIDPKRLMNMIEEMNLNRKRVNTKGPELFQQVLNASYKSA
jgi:hypothetical protein